MSSHVNILNALLSSAICALVRSRNPWIMNKERRILQRFREIFQFLGVKHASLARLSWPRSHSWHIPFSVLIKNRNKNKSNNNYINTLQ